MSESIELTVTGMKCGGCETNVREKLQAVAGVSAAQADFKNNRVSVEFDATLVTLDSIKSVITVAGFTVA
jgi:copper chaperone